MHNILFTLSTFLFVYHGSCDPEAQLTEILEKRFVDHIHNGKFIPNYSIKSMEYCIKSTNMMTSGLVAVKQKKVVKSMSLDDCTIHFTQIERDQDAFVRCFYCDLRVTYQGDPANGIRSGRTERIEYFISEVNGDNNAFIFKPLHAPDNGDFYTEVINWSDSCCTIKKADGTKQLKIIPVFST